MRTLSALPEGTLTFLLTDIQGSTRTWENDPEAMNTALIQHDEILEKGVGRHRGVQVEAGREGDSILAVFKRAEDAALCALELQRGFRAARWPAGIDLKVRVALHTGEARLRGNHYFGGALNRCARVLALCHPGQVLTTRATVELLSDLPAGRIERRDLGQHELRDLHRPEHLFQLTDPGHPEQFPPPRSGRARVTNLGAPLTRFIGRHRDLGELRRLLVRTRLLTLTGPGGCGKTRLASELAARMLPDFDDGVWFVDLAPLTDPAVLPRAVAAALGLAEQPSRPLLETIVQHCRERGLLLVLDNCEHLIAAAAEFSFALLRECPGVRLLATSREALNIPGEATRPVHPLEGEDAVSLFADRAQARSPDFELSAANGDLVAEICRRLEGIPLALELAAARLPAMTLEEMVRRLDGDGTLLAGGSRLAAARQQTLDGAIDWSYQLLTEPERQLFRRLAVFPGSFSLEAFEAVCSGSLDDLAQLISKSLVERHGARYRSLDTIRAFALERLGQAGELETQRARLAAYCLRIAADRRPGQLAAWLNQLELERDNVRAALASSLAASPATAAGLAGHLLEWWLGRGHVVEARRYLDGLLPALPDDSPARPDCLFDAAALAYTAGDFEAALRLARAGYDTAESQGNAVAACRGRRMEGVVFIATADVPAALTALEDALARSRDVGSRHEEVHALHHLGVLAAWTEDRAAAQRYFGECIELRRRLGRADESAFTLTLLAAVQVQEGNLPGARTALREALEVELALRELRAAWTLDVLSCVSVLEGRHDRGLRLAGAAASMFETTGQRPPAGWRLRFVEPILERARGELGPEAAAVAWEAGLSFTFDEALLFALDTSAVLC